MNQRQQNQITEIKKSIDDLTNNYPNIQVFTDIIKKQFELEYIAIAKPLIQSDVIDEFIEAYKEKVNDLYGLVK